MPLLLRILFLIFLNSWSNSVFAGRCTGSAYCNACTNCSRCKHCGAGGTCGVCSGGGNESYEPVVETRKPHRHKNTSSSHAATVTTSTPEPTQEPMRAYSANSEATTILDSQPQPVNSNTQPMHTVSSYEQDKTPGDTDESDGSPLPALLIVGGVAYYLYRRKKSRKA